MKTALVLCGGGAAGIRHVALLRAMDTLGIPVHFIVGASAGALCASGFSWAGISALEAMWFSIRSEDDVFHSKYWVQFPWSQGLKSAKPLKGLVQELFNQRKPGGVPFQVVATDLVSQLPIFCDNSHPDIVNMTVASASIPIVVEPYVPEGMQNGDWARAAYVDGGMLENCPLRAALNQGADRIIISHCFPENVAQREIKIKNIRDIVLNTVDTMSTETYRGDIDICGLDVRAEILHLYPEKSSIDVMDFNQGKIRPAFDESLLRAVSFLRNSTKNW